MECALTVGRTDGKNHVRLNYTSLSPIYVGPDGAEIAGGIYKWLDFDEAEARIPESSESDGP